MDKKLLLLISVTVVIVAGMLLTPSDESYATVRYVLNGVGLTLIPFIGAWIGLEAVKFFTFKSAFGKALFFISLGVITYGLGTIVFFYYNMFLQTEIPYPCLGDIGFAATIILANYGMFLLLKGIKMKFDAMTVAKLLILPIIIFAIVFPVFIYERAVEDAPLFTKFMNIYYVLGDVVFLSFALLILSISYGSILFRSVGVLSAGFILEALADFSFSYTASAGTYYTSSWVDVLYCLAFFTIGYGMYFFLSRNRAAAAPAKPSTQAARKKVR